MKKVIAVLMIVSMLLVSVSTVVAAPPGPSIVDVAIEVNEATGEFSTLIAAVLAADPAVINTLSGRGQFTVFAPTDAAFAELGFDSENIGTLGEDALTQILLYHVVRGRRDAESVLDSTRLRTLQRGFLFQEGGVLTDNLGRESTIVITDVPAANGIIHAISEVVLPFAP